MLHSLNLQGTSLMITAVCTLHRSVPHCACDPERSEVYAQACRYVANARIPHVKLQDQSVKQGWRYAHSRASSEGCACPFRFERPHVLAVGGLTSNKFNHFI